MDRRPPAPADDAAAAEWIAPRLVDTFGAVCRTVPSGFDGYARILHPAGPGGQTRRRWAEVAAGNGRTVHPLAQFARIASPVGGLAEVPLDVAPPVTGNLDPDSLRALCDTLRRHTPADLPCWFALWEGWDELSAVTGTVVIATDGDTPPPAPRSAPADRQLDLRAAKFELPGRGYDLFTGPLDDACRFGWWYAEDWFVPRSPNLFWPADRRWCVASEIDFDSTLVAGPSALIDDILHDEDLEAWAVNPLDSLAWDADTVNRG